MSKGIVSGITAMLIALAVAAMAGDMGETIGRTCSACHSTKRICQNLGAKSPEAWTDTVSRMIKHGAKLPADRMGGAVGYLTAATPGHTPFCR
ncbi:MAG: hypothetical protein V3571_07435 [Pseudodesulfovibrio sp.]